VLVEDTATDGVVVGLVSVGDLSDVRIRRPARDGFGTGLLADIGSTSVIDRMSVEEAPLDALMAFGADLGVTGLSVRGAGGAGVLAEDSDLTLTGALVEEAHGAGIDLAYTGAYAVSDTVVRNTVGDALYGEGFPIRTTDNGEVPVRLTLERVALEGGFGSGVTGDRLELTAHDLDVSDISSFERSGQWGMGIDAKSGSVSLSRSAITGVHNAGIWLGSGVVNLVEVSVGTVASQSCAPTTCPTETAASAVFVGPDVSATLTTVLLEGAGVGLQVRGEAVASDVVCRDNAFGVDATDGDLVTHRVSLDGNTADRADEAQVAPDTSL
jgi:hypothetical protein